MIGGDSLRTPQPVRLVYLVPPILSSEILSNLDWSVTTGGQESKNYFGDHVFCDGLSVIDLISVDAAPGFPS